WVGAAAAAEKQNAARPNLLWIIAEDCCPDIGCYGTKEVKTPNLDALAGEGALFRRAFTTAPVCSASRSAMMVGMYQHCVGASQHRTANKKPLPEGVRTYLAHLRDAGYYTCTAAAAKTDLNYVVDEPLFDGKGWEGRKPGQPFVCQATIPTTHRAFKRDKENPIDPASVVIPPYYPDHPVTRRDWADYLESWQLVDRQVGELLKKLKDDGLADNTVVVFIGDHGRCHVRGKQFLYDGGLHIPLLVRWPGKIKPGTERDDMVSSIDITATLVAAGAGKVPAHMQGRDLFAEDRQERECVFAHRDKMDDTHDAMRAVRTKDFKYILNLMPERAYCQLNEYKERSYPVLALLNVMHMKGELNPVQDRFMADHKPPVELYDLRSDPFETVNLAGDPKYAEAEKQLAALLTNWRQETGDQDPSDEFRRGGWSPKYPTHSLEQWEGILAKWEKQLFQGRPKPEPNQPKRKQK
ncbi:MAG: sulfatase, partial [Planctomycetales bacterium]|nr:sulfatase [Planctomycetales bacterium]